MLTSRKTALGGYSSGGSQNPSESPGQKLKRIRERLNLRYRDVEEASILIAGRRKSDEFIIQLSRLSDIENKGTLPSIFRLYSLCTIYRLDLMEVMSWYGVGVADQPGDAAAISVEKTHLIGFGPPSSGDVQVPLALDPGLDTRRTSYLSRLIQKWGTLPLALLNTLDIRDHRYALIGSEDWSMYPLIQPGALVMIDESQKRVVNSGWADEFERPIYFLEHRAGFACSWCTLNDDHLVLQPHPASLRAPEIFKFPRDIDVVGQVTGVAMRLDPAQRRRSRA